MTVFEILIVVTLRTALGTILVQQARNTGSVSLTALPIVASHCVLESFFLLLLGPLFVLDPNGHLTDH